MPSAIRNQIWAAVMEHQSEVLVVNVNQTRLPLQVQCGSEVVCLRTRLFVHCLDYPRVFDCLRVCRIGVKLEVRELEL